MIERKILFTTYQRDWVFNILKLLTFVGCKKYIHNIILFVIKSYKNNNKKQWKYYTKHTLYKSLNL